MTAKALEACFHVLIDLIADLTAPESLDFAVRRDRQVRHAKDDISMHLRGIGPDGREEG